MLIPSSPSKFRYIGATHFFSIKTSCKRRNVLSYPPVQYKNVHLGFTLIADGFSMYRISVIDIIRKTPI